VCTIIQKLENLITILLDFILDVHLTTAPVLLLPAEGFVIPTGFRKVWLYDIMDISTSVMLHLKSR
jgi:hypothetical protein